MARTKDLSRFTALTGVKAWWVMTTIEEINRELAGNVMLDIQYITLLNTKIALLNTKVGLLEAENQRLRELIKDISDWYEINEQDYMPKGLWRRIVDEQATRKGVT
jgi:hypothetical protein